MQGIYIFPTFTQKPNRDGPNGFGLKNKKGSELAGIYF